VSQLPDNIPLQSNAREQLGYVKGLDGSPLYAAYHFPDSGKAGRPLPVVIAPPLFEERKSAYAALRRLATQLAAAGHPVMRFDYRGSGESGGSSAARRWEHLAQDLMTVRKTLAALTGKRDAALVGLRLGATVALQESIRVGGECVVALAPIVSGATQERLWKMRSKIRSELTTAGGAADSAAQAATESLDFDGYDVHPKFFEDVAAIDLVKDLGRLSCPGLVVQLSHKQEPAAESTQLLNTLGSRAKLECLRMEAFWDKVDDADIQPMNDTVLNFLNGV
jgi:pimeloyl-ACP methyl ester carboxylesterase